VITSEQAAEVVRLFHAEKWKIGTIAAQLHVHHGTVRRVLARAGVTPASRAQRPSIVGPYVPLIVETLEAYPRLPASRLFVMAKERGYSGSPDHFRRWVARHRPRPMAEAYLRLRTLPGEQAQVDWAHFGQLTVGNASRQLMAFVMVLSFSRMVFLRFYLNANMSSFLHGHVSAFDFWGGVPRVLLYDNLKSAVLERKGDAIRFHPTLLELSAHYRYEPRPVAVARGNEKGRVERAIQYVRTSFFPARKYRDLDDLNDQALEWCRTTAAERRSHENEKLLVRDAYEHERPSLLGLSENAFVCDERVEADVGRTPYVRFDLNDYSLPATITRRSVTVVASLNRVRVFDGIELVAEHRRSWDRRQLVEDPTHIAALVEHKRKAREGRGLDRLYHSAPSSRGLFRVLAEQGKNLGGATITLIKQLDLVGAAELEHAIAEALRRGTPHLAAVRHVLERRRYERGLPPAVGNHLPLDPRVQGPGVTPHPLTDYDDIGKDHDHDC
jgi:transposase